MCTLRCFFHFIVFRGTVLRTSHFPFLFAFVSSFILEKFSVVEHRCFFLAFFWNLTFEPHLFFTATFISTRYIFQLTFLFRVHIILFAHAIPTFYMTSFDSAIFALVDTLGFDFMWNILFSRENRGRSLGWIKFYRERRKMSGKFIPPHTAYAAYKSEPLDSYIHRLFAKIVDIII